ncbi:hypothetical protein Hanom_Chr00s194146g01835821 [Helianthus anomalus]
MESRLFYCSRRNGQTVLVEMVRVETVRVETARVETRIGPKQNYFVGLVLQVVVVFLPMLPLLHRQPLHHSSQEQENKLFLPVDLTLKWKLNCFVI